MVVGIAQAGGVRRCMVVGEEQIGADGVGVGIVVVTATDHTEYQIILATLLVNKRAMVAPRNPSPSRESRSLIQILYRVAKR